MNSQEIEDAARDYCKGRESKLEENLSFIDFINGATMMLPILESKDKEIAELTELLQKAYQNITVLEVQKEELKLEIAELKKQLEPIYKRNKYLTQ